MNTKQTIAGLLLVLGTWSASADPVTFYFTGEITSSDGSLFGGFPVGTPVTGSYTYDSGLVDSDSSPDVDWFSNELPAN